MEQNLTKDADKLVCVIYKHFLEKRQSGVSKTRAKDFGSSATIHKELVPDWLFDDVDDTCRELSRAKLLDCLWADDVAYHVILSDYGVSYMENRFKNGLKEITAFVAKFIPIIGPIV